MPCVKIALRQKAERTDGQDGMVGNSTKRGEVRGRLIGRGATGSASESKMVWTKSARGDKRLAGETKESVTREERRPICHSCNGGARVEAKASEWYFGGEEQSLEGTASGRLRLALGNARLAHLLRRGVAASNILSWRMIASLTLIYRPSKVGLPPSLFT